MAHRNDPHHFAWQMPDDDDLIDAIEEGIIDGTDIDMTTRSQAECVKRSLVRLFSENTAPALNASPVCAGSPLPVGAGNSGGEITPSSPAFYSSESTAMFDAISPDEAERLLRGPYPLTADDERDLAASLMRGSPDQIILAMQLRGARRPTPIEAYEADLDAERVTAAAYLRGLHPATWLFAAIMAFAGGSIAWQVL